MSTIVEVATAVMPSGSTGAGGIERTPVWPPDVFAVAATLVERSGLYSARAFNARWDPLATCSTTPSSKT